MDFDRFEALLLGTPAAAPAAPRVATPRAATPRAALDLSAVARLAVSLKAMPWAQLPPWAGFVLTQIDGSTTYEELLLISGQPEAEVLALLQELVAAGMLA